MRVTVHSKLDALDEKYWKVYQRSFDDLRAVAVQRHLMNRDEFDAVIGDERVTKYVAQDDVTGRLAALATMTNDLGAVPLISPDYFEQRWPDRYLRGEIWYVPFVGVDPDFQGTGAMGLIIGLMCEVPKRSGGAICVDVCVDVESRIRLPLAIERIAGTYAPGIRRTRLDAQVYWGYEFPMPA